MSEDFVVGEGCGLRFEDLYEGNTVSVRAGLTGETVTSLHRCVVIRANKYLRLVI